MKTRQGLVSNSRSENLCSSGSDLYSLSPLQNKQCSVECLLAILFPLHKLPSQRSETRAPSNRQPLPQFLFHSCNLIHHLATALSLTLMNSVHGGGKEEADRFIDVLDCGDGRQRKFGEGFGDADDGFELTDGDRDGGASVGVEFGGVDLFSDRDEMGRELFLGFGGEAGSAAAKK